MSEVKKPVQRINAHVQLEFADFIGRYMLVEGDMVFVEGPLTIAMRLGQPFILDDRDMLDQGVNASLNTVIEQGYVTIEENGGEVVTAAPGFRFMAYN